MNYQGVIIEESLSDPAVLGQVKILATKVEEVTEKHKTPWIKQWTLHTVELPEESVDKVAKQISHDLNKEHSWYADFKNDKFHFIVYRDKVFKVDLQNPTVYKDAKDHGVSIGIPVYQVDFAPDDEVWDR